ncbi:MAG: hypothetical protein HOJ90_08290 [Alphaproteobacteria bacterium]|jgi:hypothetical protein|nr:hypothetical protein [Alphaproteobacteria bacterium]
MVQSKPTVGRQRFRRAVVIVMALVFGGGLIGFAYAQSGISLNSPVSFPVDI